MIPYRTQGVDYDTVSAIANLPYQKSYYCLDEDEDEAGGRQAVVERRGDSVYAYVADQGGYCDLPLYCLKNLANALTQAEQDARIYQKAISEYFNKRRENLECDLIGKQVSVTYDFTDYTVGFSREFGKRICSIQRAGDKTVLERRECAEKDAPMTLEAAASELKAFLMQKK